MRLWEKIGRISWAPKSGVWLDLYITPIDGGRTVGGAPTCSFPSPVAVTRRMSPTICNFAPNFDCAHVFPVIALLILLPRAFARLESLADVSTSAHAL